FPNAQLNFVAGTQFLSKSTSPVPPELVTLDGKPGVRASYYSMNDMLSLLNPANLVKPLATRVEPGIGLATGPVPPESEGKSLLVVRWEGTFTPNDTGDFNFGIAGDGFLRVSLDGKVTAMSFHTNGVETKTGRAVLQAGHPYALTVEYAGAPG